MSITQDSRVETGTNFSFNDPKFYTQVMPERHIGSRVYELVYGEMRLARYMLVLREHIKYWTTPGPKDKPFKVREEFATDAELLGVWGCIDDRRKLSWPTMVPLVESYIDTVFGREQYERVVKHTQRGSIVWIDAVNGIQWQRKIIDKYDKLVAGTNYKDL